MKEKINVEGFEIEIMFNAVRKTHKDGCAGFFRIKVDDVERQIFGVWDNEYERAVVPCLFETAILDGVVQFNEPEMSIILAENGEVVLTAEMVARELVDLT